MLYLKQFYSWQGFSVTPIPSLQKPKPPPEQLLKTCQQLPCQLKCFMSILVTILLYYLLMPLSWLSVIINPSSQSKHYPKGKILTTSWGSSTISPIVANYSALSAGLIPRITIVVDFCATMYGSTGVEVTYSENAMHENPYLTLQLISGAHHLEILRWEIRFTLKLGELRLHF